MTTQALTMDSLQVRVPSAFATHAHDSRSSRYTYIPTSNVIEGMMQAGFMPFQATESRYRNPGKAGYTKHMIRFRQSDAQLIVGDSFFEVVLVNSHDGSSAYKLMAGIYRLVCSNGMTVSESECASIHVRHSGNVIPQVVEGAQQILENAPRTIETVKAWRGLQLSQGEQAAFADSARILRFADAEGNVETPITSEQLLRPRRHADNEPSLWHTFNRVQENVTKGGLSAYGRDALNRSRRVTTRQIKGIDQDVKLNRALWNLAERMAELKGSAAAA